MRERHPIYRALLPVPLSQMCRCARAKCQGSRFPTTGTTTWRGDYPYFCISDARCDARGHAHQTYVFEACLANIRVKLSRLSFSIVLYTVVSRRRLSSILGNVFMGVSLSGRSYPLHSTGTQVHSTAVLTTQSQQASPKNSKYDWCSIACAQIHNVR